MKPVGVLLAAGSSRRMGRLKQLLPFGDRTVLDHGLANFRAAGVGTTVVVLGHAADRIRAQLADPFASEDVVAVVNPHHDHGMFGSVQCGVRAAASMGADVVLLALVDQPFIPAVVYAAVLAAHQAGANAVTVPSFAGRRGHPVALSMDLRDAILSPEDPGATLRDVIRAHDQNTGVVPVDADEILRDMDLPADYADELQRWLAGRGG